MSLLFFAFIVVATGYAAYEARAIHRYLRGEINPLEEADVIEHPAIGRSRRAQRIWFRLESDEHERLMRWHHASARFMAKVAIVIGILLLAIAAVPEAPHTAVAAIGITAMAVVVAGAFTVEFALTRRTFASTTQIVVDGWGVRCVSAGKSWSSAWTELQRWTEQPDGVLVDFSGSRTLYIPRRVFENDARWRAMLASFTGRLIAV
jgi:hypothetical protein